MKTILPQTGPYANQVCVIIASAKTGPLRDIDVVSIRPKDSTLPIYWIPMSECTPVK